MTPIGTGSSDPIVSPPRTPSPPREWNVAVVGLGTAGAAAAVLLHRLGHRVTVLEQAAAPAAVGAGIWLQGLGQQVLDRMGLLDELRSASTVVSRVSAMTTSGRVVMDFGYDDLPGAIPALASTGAPCSHCWTVGWPGSPFAPTPGWPLSTPTTTVSWWWRPTENGSAGSIW